VRTLLHHSRKNLRTGRMRERFELGELRIDRTARIVRVDGDDERSCRRYVVSGRKCSMSQESPSL
jgi:hypothetical protein